jgi:hypothetical protein
MVGIGSHYYLEVRGRSHGTGSDLVLERVSRTGMYRQVCLPWGRRPVPWDRSQTRGRAGR